MIQTLYLCYFGLREPLVQTQVLPYLRQISRAGIGVTLLTFEPRRRDSWPNDEREKWRNLLQGQGIQWHALSYHKRPSLPATLYDIALGAYYATRLVRKQRIDVLHARSHIPVAMALMVKRFTGCKLVFDLRGLMAEEYVDAGIWKEGSTVFRSIKWLERIGLRQADQIVVLTERLRDWLVEHNLASKNDIEVIPCCTDFSLYFNDTGEITASGPGRFEVIYTGSVTGLYELEEMGKFFRSLSKMRPDAYLRILTKSSISEATAKLLRAGLNENDFWVGSATHDEVPWYLHRAHLGLSFRKPTFSQIAASPTKIPEYLAAGLPVVCNAGVGDTDEVVSNERVGVIVKSFTEDDYTLASRQLIELLKEPGLSQRCRDVARSYFDLDRVGGVKYRLVYQRLS